MNFPHSRDFTHDTFFEAAMTQPRPLMRPEVVRQEGIETDALLELRYAYSGIPDDVFFKIYEFVKQTGGRKKKHVVSKPFT
jgi:hypothetical protein